MILDPTALADALATVQGAIAAAAAARPGADVTLIAVSKTQPAAACAALLAAGQRVFGENRVQEAESKWPALRARWPELELHLIGQLQTNKVEEAAALFDVIHSLDRLRLGEALARQRDRTGRCPRCLIQVNTGAEPQKGGVLPEELPALVEHCRDRLGLPVEGLMCLPPQDENPALHFALLAELARRQRLTGLSMGMSDDFPVAIRFGATHVRIGTALFGDRPAPNP